VNRPEPSRCELAHRDRKHRQSPGRALHRDNLEQRWSLLKISGSAKGSENALYPKLRAAWNYYEQCVVHRRENVCIPGSRFAICLLSCCKSSETFSSVSRGLSLFHLNEKCAWSLAARDLIDELFYLSPRCNPPAPCHQCKSAVDAMIAQSRSKSLRWFLARYPKRGRFSNCVTRLAQFFTQAPHVCIHRWRVSITLS